MRKYLIILFSLVLFISMVGSSTSFAVGKEENVGGLDSTMDQLMDYVSEFEDVNYSEEKTLSDLAQRDIERGLINLNSQGELDFDKVFVKKMKDSGDYTVRIPIIHEDYEVISGITVVYDNNRDFQYFLESIVYEDDGTGYLKTWKDNELQTEHNIDIGEFEEETGDIEIALAKTGWGCINDCLSANGLPTWVLGLVGVGCAAVCVGTAGLGCVICIQGLGLGYAAIFDYCLNVKCR